MTTPGPWSADQFTIKDPEGVTVAMVWPDKRVSSDDSIARMNANATAIAAVPHLVSALRQVAPHGRNLQHGANVSVSATAYGAVCDALERAGIKL